MKNVAAFLALIAALIFSPWLATETKAQPCQWNYAFVNNQAVATYCGTVQSAGGVTLTSIASIALMQALPLPIQNQAVIVASTQGAGSVFIFNSSACNNAGAGDNGTQFPAVGGGCWIRQFNGAFYANWWNDGVRDIGAQINAAYAALPTFGGQINIPASPTGARYNFTTPIVLTTLGKHVRLVGQAPSGSDAAGALPSSSALLNFTPTSGAAITIDTESATNTLAQSNSIENISLVNNMCATTGGCGSSAIGILIGGTNGGDNTYAYQNIAVQGFGIGYKNSTNQFINCCQNFYSSQFNANTVAFDTNANALTYYGGQIAANGAVFQDTSSDTTKSAELFFIGADIVDNVSDPVFKGVGLVHPAILHFTNSHLENSPSLTSHYFQGNLNVIFNGGVLENDNSAGSTDWFAKLDDFKVFSMFGTQMSSANPVTTVLDATNFVTGNVFPVFTSGSTISNIVTGVQAAHSNWCAIQNAFTNIPCHWANNVLYEQNVTMPGLAAAAAGSHAVCTNPATHDLTISTTNTCPP